MKPGKNSRRSAKAKGVRPLPGGALLMEALEQLARSVIALDEVQIAILALNQPDVKNLIIKLNTQDQLFKKGEDSRRISLEDIGGPYSDFTVEIKKAKGQPVDRVTLKDTGDFYESFVVRITNDAGIEIDADPFKDDTNLFQEWGIDILGLNEENLQKIIDVMAVNMVEEITKAIC